jgi:hypothetical protein
MKILEQFNYHAMLTSVSVTVKGLLTNPVVLLSAGTGISFINIFTYRPDLMISLGLATFCLFGTMTLMGLVKHIKDGELNGKIFWEKTVTQFVVMFCVVLLGFLAATVISVVVNVATSQLEGVHIVPGVALYFMMAGFMIMIAYYFIKTCDLIDQILPNLLPAWFSAPFRKFRVTGNFKDLVNFSGSDSLDTETLAKINQLLKKHDAPKPETTTLP